MSIFSELNPKQLEAARSSSSSLLITAGAGSGKTKTLTARLLWFLEQGVRADSIIAITFTNKAAAELKERSNLVLERNGITQRPYIGTFHSLSAKFLRSEASKLGRTPSFSIYDDSDSEKTIKNIFKTLDIDKNRYPVSSIKNRISRIKNELLDPEEIFNGNKELVSIYENYESSLASQNAFDFDDLIAKLALLFKNDSETLSKYTDRFTHFLIDEYQDVNTSQYLLTKLLASKTKNITVVGDDHQSIYSFRSADFRNFLNFEKDYPEAKIITLDQNYRSTKTIVGAASAVVSNNKFQRPKTLWTENETGSPIRISRYYSAESEADNLVNKIYGKDYGNITILYRTNAQSRPIESSLILNRIPYQIFGGLKFYDRREIKDIVSVLRVTNNPLDEAGIDRIFKSFGKIKGRKLIERLPEIRLNKPKDVISFIISESDLILSLQKEKNFEERFENIKELVSFSENFETLDEMIERISLLETADSPKGSEENSVRLMTVHTAKGLEFEEVYLVGVSEGTLPHERSMMSLDDLEEERRLMYVAMTRAKRKLNISFFGSPSRFISEIPSEFAQYDNFDFDSDFIYLS